MVETREKAALENVQTSFNQLIEVIKEVAKKNLPQTIQAIHTLESSILNYEIRGTKIFTYVTRIDDTGLRITTDDPHFHQDDDKILKYLENVLNGFEEPRNDIKVEIVNVDEPQIDVEEPETPVEVYYREMSVVGEAPARNKAKDMGYRAKTILSAFHLIGSIMSLCEEEHEQSVTRNYGAQDLNYPLRAKYRQKSVRYPPEFISEYMPKRLKSQIASLQNSKTFQEFLNGEIRIASKEQRVSYVVSTGVNCNEVELGLDLNNQPLAVKRVPKRSWVGKMVKTLVEPLLGLMDNHILHYFACEYEMDELILATPLCKWNISQYIQVLRHSSVAIMPALTAMEIVKQLLDGLLVLHRCEIPIVHGNMKPTNVFIDFNGLVKIAEFGIHKVLLRN